MQKNISVLKKIAFFCLLALIVPWLNMALFFTLLSADSSKETLSFIQENEDELYNSIYKISLLAFIATYFIAIHLINKKISKKFLKIIFYILVYFGIFLLFCFLP
ncbi:MAG: hypothetical protein IJ660_04620 [Alphaproteobacteria bacterium]|nr:hypothetical protein [Alphaproteobacteria bacterium]